MIYSTCAVGGTQRPLLNVGSAASGLLTECTWNMYMYMCAARSPSRTRLAITSHTLRLRTDFPRCREGLRVGREPKSSRTRKAQQRTQYIEQRRQMPSEECDLDLLLAADGFRTRSPCFHFAGETRMKIRSRTASISLEGAR